MCAGFLKPRFWFLEWGAISGARFEPPFGIWACVTSGLLRLPTGHAKLSAFVPWRHPMSVPCSSTSTCGCRLAPKTGRHRMSLAFYQMPLRLLTGYVLNMGIVTVTFTHKILTTASQTNVHYCFYTDSLVKALIRGGCRGVDSRMLHSRPGRPE